MHVSQWEREGQGGWAWGVKLKANTTCSPPHPLGIEKGYWSAIRTLPVLIRTRPTPVGSRAAAWVIHTCQTSLVFSHEPIAPNANRAPGSLRRCRLRSGVKNSQRVCVLRVGCTWCKRPMTTKTLLFLLCCSVKCLWSDCFWRGEAQLRAIISSLKALGPDCSDVCEGGEGGGNRKRLLCQVKWRIYSGESSLHWGLMGLYWVCLTPAWLWPNQALENLQYAVCTSQIVWPRQAFTKAIKLRNLLVTHSVASLLTLIEIIFLGHWLRYD